MIAFILAGCAGATPTPDPDGPILTGFDPLRLTLISVAFTVVVLPFIVLPFLVLMNDEASGLVANPKTFGVTDVAKAAGNPCPVGILAIDRHEVFGACRDCARKT